MYGVEDGRPRKTLSKVAEKDYQSRQLCKVDAVHCWKWRKSVSLLQIDNHSNASSLKFTARMPLLAPNQKCQSTEGSYSF